MKLSRRWTTTPPPTKGWSATGRCSTPDLSPANPQSITGSGLSCIPITYADNYNNDPTTAIGLINPHLRTPYVQEWSLGYSRISRAPSWRPATSATTACSYSGVRLQPGPDQQQRIPGGLPAGPEQRLPGPGAHRHVQPCVQPHHSRQPAADRVSADWRAAGPSPMPVVLADIAAGQVAELATYYQINGLNGLVNFFQNPNALGTNYLTNFSNSTYNALQIDVRHRVDRDCICRPTTLSRRCCRMPTGTTRRVSIRFSTCSTGVSNGRGRLSISPRVPSQRELRFAARQGTSVERGTVL